MYIRKLIAIGCAALLMGLTSGCAYKVTGGGWIPSADDPLEKANFGFGANGCEAYKIEDDWVNFKGRFNYHDRTAGVMMLGEPTAVTRCSRIGCRYMRTRVCPSGYLLGLDYRSTNPKDRGEGTAGVCVYDNGEGVNADPDFLAIYVEGGPYDGYSNEGDVQGNIQKHECHPGQNPL